MLATRWLLPLLVLTVVGCGHDTDPTTVDLPSTAAAPLVPSGLSWRTWQGVDLPFSQQGPTETDGAVASGFDRSPAGAALTAIQATVRMSIAPDGQWAMVGQRMLATGAARDAWATARAQVSITAPAGQDAPSILGYVVTDYADAQARVQIYAGYRDNSLTCHTATVVWRDGDWRLQLPDRGENPITAVESTPLGMVALNHP
ncbi:hypothetical protein [Nocardia sp. NPDC058497]|uniref:hypothetical protein n=1 Tax=Nocardia sp. NPDC058497 TaxID=3346529 RepID=UPI003666ECCF